MLYVAVEVAIYVWMPTYLSAYAGSFVWLPAYALSIFFVLRALGRFVRRVAAGARVLDDRARADQLRRFCCVSRGRWFTASKPVPGCCRSRACSCRSCIPTLNSKGISCFPKSQHGAAAGVILFFTAAAAALGPLAMAAVSDAYGSPRAGFVLATAVRAASVRGPAPQPRLQPSAAQAAELGRRRVRQSQRPLPQSTE